MIETAINQAQRDAFEAAHKARADAAGALFKFVFGFKWFPLGRRAFTGSLRWA